jgi:hypothetical protein
VQCFPLCFLSLSLSLSLVHGVALHLTRHSVRSMLTGSLPDFVSCVVKKLNDAATVTEDVDGERVERRRRWPESDQLTVNEYEAGVGIGAHIDTHSGTLPPHASTSRPHAHPLEQRSTTASYRCRWGARA